jgi:CDP-glycerol glycerophosphotransferase (TagB/SpsB family)
MKKLLLFAGFILKFLSFFIPIKKNLWLIGAQDGDSYIENSKYLFEFLVSKNTDIEVYWVTRSKKVFELLKSNGFPVIYNLSLIGISKILSAQVFAFSTMRSDILFAYKKQGRIIVNLWHGMPIKKIVYDYEPHAKANQTFKAKLWSVFVVGFEHNQTDLICSTSEFYNEILASCFRNKNVYVTGQPRTDLFFQNIEKQVKEELKLDVKDIAITYMPTHRAYGKGEMNPRLFDTDIAFQEKLAELNAKLIWKYHKNMKFNFSTKDFISDQILDLSAKDIDPQKLLLGTDILITDYSSCYIDFLLLDRPIIFYHYDNYQVDDNPVYFSIADNNPGVIVQTETDLKEAIVNILKGKDDFKETRKYYKEKYHKYIDGNSSKRVVENVIKLVNV